MGKHSRERRLEVGISSRSSSSRSSSSSSIRRLPPRAAGRAASPLLPLGPAASRRFPPLVGGRWRSGSGSSRGRGRARHSRHLRRARPHSSRSAWWQQHPACSIQPHRAVPPRLACSWQQLAAPTPPPMSHAAATLAERRRCLARGLGAQQPG
jgi:hypothetical protein